MKSKVNAGLPMLKTMCATCPFRASSPHANLVPVITETLLDTTSICHSTGSNNAINRRTGKPPMACRGARDVQLKYFHSIGFLEAPTDEAWNKKFAELTEKKNDPKS